MEPFFADGDFRWRFHGRLRVLKLKWWMHNPEDHLGCVKRELEPHVGRDGYYSLRRAPPYGLLNWFEVGGRAFEVSYALDFKSTLDKHHHKPLREIERNALQVLIYAGLAIKEQRELLYYDDHYRDLIRLRRGYYR
jgi:hypothetical protein